MALAFSWRDDLKAQSLNVEGGARRARVLFVCGFLAWEMDEKGKGKRCDQDNRGLGSVGGVRAAACLPPCSKEKKAWARSRPQAQRPNKTKTDNERRAHLAAPHVRPITQQRLKNRYR